MLNKNLAALPLTGWESLANTELKDKLEKLEDGGMFREFGIRNFLEGDLISWYLNDYNPPIDSAIRDIVKRLNQYDPETIELVPDETRDILKKLYQFLVPKAIRHDLGEYYTPDWIAERCLDQGFEGSTGGRAFGLVSFPFTGRTEAGAGSCSGVVTLDQCPLGSFSSRKL